MNDDDRLLLDARRWLKDEDVVVPDPEEAGRRVAAQLTRTRQLRRRWWPLPSFKGASVAPPSIHGTDFQPTPIPATNGRSPTVSRRTKSMFSPVKASIAGAVVFAVGGAFLIAQPFQQQGSAPGAEIPAEPEITQVTLKVRPGGESRPLDWASVNGVSLQTGACWTPTLSDASDPRIDGRLAYCLDASNLAVDTVQHVTYRIENDQGAWQGSTVSFLTGGADADTQTVLLTGEGAYDGWHTWLDVSDWDGVTGAIFNFPPPEAPIPPAVE